MKGLHMVAFILLVIGGLNWLLVGLFSSWDLASILGSTVATIIYILVGLSALVMLFTHKKDCKMCGKGQGSGMGSPMPH
ncbi:MAG: DUF378 domain-containing protein [Candidatus Harrisonbacteria bacterium CG10_big_fil_rev_8_21_14_0_10_40_38]|uniref:DUF378 domain-containing protein n=1 Tax=Candidatus Harrisonbacteria bacterium CG10_big_fil_rev_8_21_14_0_10_40_38 TaxID=1974583 RepID=A0A2H0UUI0_9BACT|nr:MAG: DUF378 domain-containing protein [Candidatus Harrisonbacteria bacterium CG10_big_fil_rev_8_21_14_0_10_40_38]